MSSSDKATFRSQFAYHYRKLRPILYLWNANSHFDNDDDDTTYKQSFVIKSTTPVVFDLDKNVNHVCNGNRCEPDVIKCPIEHMLLVEGKDKESELVFDFQPMSKKSTEDDENGRNILRYRAEYGIFDADFYKRHDGQPLKQGDMKTITIYHPRYQLKTILTKLNSIKPYQYPIGMDKKTAIREMGRRYIFLSGDYIERNSTFTDSSITSRERQMMIDFHGIPGSWDMLDPDKVGDDRNICSINKAKGKNIFQDGNSNVNLHVCRYSGNSCVSRYDKDGPMDRCRRCGDDCNDDTWVSRPCSRNVWYSSDIIDEAYQPLNPVENGDNKMCPFDGYGTEIPDEVNDKDNVCWKEDYLKQEWDGKCKDFIHFKQNYCAGSPGDDLKYHNNSDDYTNARYFKDDNCKFKNSASTQEDLTKMCTWAGETEYTGNIGGEGLGISDFCGCNKRLFVNMGKESYFMKLGGNKNKLRQIKEWSKNSFINGAIPDPATSKMGLRSTDKGIIDQIPSNCWISCQTLKLIRGDNFISALDDEAQQSCSIQGCFNSIDIYDNKDLDVSSTTIDQSCSYTTSDGRTGSGSSGDNNDNDNEDDNEDDENGSNILLYIMSGLCLCVICIIIIVLVFVATMPTKPSRVRFNA